MRLNTSMTGVVIPGLIAGVIYAAIAAATGASAVAAIIGALLVAAVAIDIAYSVSIARRWRWLMISNRSRHSRRTVPTQRSAKALARGAAAGT